MEILRVETFAKVGLYMSKIERPVTNWDRHPLPSGDDKLREVWLELAYPRDWYFGFKDMNQLLKWWPKYEWKDFFRHNEENATEETTLGISTYDVDMTDLHIGETQVIFILERAERLRFQPFQRDNVGKRLIKVMACQ